MKICQNCSQNINFYSESETYEYFEHNGKIRYLCEDCLKEYRDEIN